MRLLPALAASACLLASGAFAETHSALRQDYLTPYAGVFDLTNNNPRNLAQFGLEYRFRDVFYGLRPTLGVNADVKGGAYAYGGINWEIPLGSSAFVLIPNFMAGAYRQGDGKDLGGAIEFRSGIELDYQLANAHRIGIAFNHISNASIYDKNPGAETVLVNYSIPIGALTGW